MRCLGHRPDVATLEHHERNRLDLRDVRSPPCRWPSARLWHIRRPSLICDTPPPTEGRHMSRRPAGVTGTPVCAAQEGRSVTVGRTPLQFEGDFAAVSLSTSAQAEAGPAAYPWLVRSGDNWPAPTASRRRDHGKGRGLCLLGAHHRRERRTDAPEALVAAPAGMAHALDVDRFRVRRSRRRPAAVPALRLERDVCIRVLRDAVQHVPQDGPRHRGRRVRCGWFLISTSASVAAEKSPRSRAVFR